MTIFIFKRRLSLSQQLLLLLILTTTTTTIWTTTTTITSIYGFSIINNINRSNSNIRQQQQQSTASTSIPTSSTTSTTALFVARYGPVDIPQTSNKDDDNENYDEDDDDDDEDFIALQKLKAEFQAFLQQAITISKSNHPDHLPRFLANHIELLMSIQDPKEGIHVIDDVIQQAKQKVDDANANANVDAAAAAEQDYQFMLQVIDIVLSFAEEVSKQLLTMDDQYKHLLGKIIKIMATKADSIDAAGKNVGLIIPERAHLTSRDREEELEELLKTERHALTPGFLRHLEGECTRIANAPKLTRESTRLLDILRMIHARVLEEIGNDMGEATIVLGQLIAYDDDDELIGVLEAGLQIRGREFAVEMSDLTNEALDGFQRVPNDASGTTAVDPELVRRVKLINDRLKEYLEESNEFL